MPKRTSTTDVRLTYEHVRLRLPTKKPFLTLFHTFVCASLKMNNDTWSVCVFLHPPLSRACWHLCATPSINLSRHYIYSI